MILAILFGVLSFLISPFGIMTLLIGVLAFIGLPMISTATSFKAPANFFLKLATFPLNRVAIVISEHNDALMKQMKYDGLGFETINIDDETKVFEDPDNALHHFLGIPFALADEEHGVLFDPRHAATGMRKRMKNSRNEATYLATEEEWGEWGIGKWMPGVFELPKKHELVDLSAVQELIDGGERSEFAERVEELYKHSRAPFDSGTPAMKFLYPILALAITFGGVWFMVSQFGLPFANSGPQPDSTVGYGALLTLLVSSAGLSKKKIGGIALGILIPVGIIAALYVVFNLVLAVAVTVAFLLGFLLLPFLTVLSKPSKLLSGLLSKLYFKLGFFGFRQPVITWTQSKYVVKEWDELDHTDDVTWYDLWGHTIGFSYEPDESSWDAEPVPHAEIENQQPVADGGTRKSNLPPKFVRSSQMKRDTYGAYLPKRVRDDSYYIHTGIALERFNNSANGEKSLKKLLEAKEIHGSGSDGIDDTMVFKATLVSGIIGLLAGVGIFVVPAFL